MSPDEELLKLKAELTALREKQRALADIYLASLWSDQSTPEALSDLKQLITDYADEIEVAKAKIAEYLSRD